MTRLKYLYELVVNINSLTNYVHQHLLYREGCSISHPHRFRNWHFIITYLRKTENCSTSDNFKPDDLCDYVMMLEFHLVFHLLDEVAITFYGKQIIGYD